MARPAEAWPDNAPGDVYVDRTCIDCGMCRIVAPETFAEADDHSFVGAQPTTPEGILRARMAIVACPTGSIGARATAPMKAAVAAFPVEVLPNVFLCGFASPDSYGASAWLVRRPDGNVLVDSPRAAAPLLAAIARMGGVRWMFLTHRDDVADHAAFAGRFGCTRVMHRRDVGTNTGDVELLLDGDDAVPLADDLLAVPVPGHTAGSTALLFRDDVLFSGDHLWGTHDGRLQASRSVCWYDWPTQLRSIARLLDFEFTHVLPGHGRPWHGADANAALRALLG